MSHRNANGQLTREGMEHVINNGGSVNFKGRIISNHADLPDLAEVAQGDEQAEKAALAAIDQQQKALNEQRKRLVDSAKGRKDDAKGDEDVDEAAAILRGKDKKKKDEE